MTQDAQPKIGIIMLVHESLQRAEQIARVWANADCPVVIHVDSSVSDSIVKQMQRDLGDLALVSFCQRFRCEWGSWGLVAATLAASEKMLEQHEDIGHVYLSSGSCLPLRPVHELIEYLAKRPNVDFIESASLNDVDWTVGGFDRERFERFFPFSWKRQRRLFDWFIQVQRRLKIKRSIPEGITPHMGSQWWCLSRSTLDAIVNNPNRDELDTYFKGVWIPDESYFQTLARKHSTSLESRSLTLSKFDFQGKPHVFYDDHLQLLKRSDCFVARKIWPKANRLYDYFLNITVGPEERADPSPSKIDRIFSRAYERRVYGRQGLYMQSRFPWGNAQHAISAEPYSVFEGFHDIFENFDQWLLKIRPDIQLHGRLFHPERAEFTQGQTMFAGAMTDSAKVRDRNPQAFLTNLIWNTRGTHQAFHYGPGDTQKIGKVFAEDPNAYIAVISGAWAVSLFHSGRTFNSIRKTAALYQRQETEHLLKLRATNTKARVRIWSLADIVDAPVNALQTVMQDMHIQSNHLTELPVMRDLSGFSEFIQELKNQGMHPYTVGDYPMPNQTIVTTAAAQKPYVIK